MAEELNISDLVEYKWYGDYFGLGIVVDVERHSLSEQYYVEVFWFDVDLREWERISDLYRCA